MEVKYTGPGPWAGENGTRDLTVTVEPACRSYTVRLAFASPAGRVYITPPLTLTDGEATYPLPSCLLDAPGKLRAQAVAESGDGKIAKSEIACFRVERSIAARAAREPETGELISLCTLHTVLAGLSAAVDGKAAAAHTHAYDDLTGKPTIPTVPVISTDILTDAASDTKTASPKAVKTYVDAVVAGGGTPITVDDAINGSSTNPVQNKVIKTALDNKQDKLTFDKNPTQNSKKPVESGGVYTALGNKQDKLTTATGTFTANFTEGTGSGLTVKRFGNFVYLSGMLTIDNGTWADVSGNHLGDITGTNIPGPSGTVMIPVVTSDGTNVHAGYIALVTVSGNVYVGMNVEETDSVMIINGFYFTA